jgi:antitoxin component YwqK of YwqJK toxin-antitoxin module
MKYKRINEEDLDFSLVNDNFFEYEGKPFTGVAYECGSVGNILSETCVLNGLRHGHVRIWDAEGGIIEETYYRKNVKFGLKRVLNIRGDTKKNILCFDGEEYNYNSLKSEKLPYVNVDIEGESILEPVKQSIMHNDEINVEDSNLLIEDGYFEYKGDSFTGVVYADYENGKREYEKNIKDGLLDGLTRKWHFTGQLQAKNYFKKAVRDGSWKEWYPSGEFKSETNYAYSNLLEQKIWADGTGALLEHTKTYYDQDILNTVIEIEGFYNVKEKKVSRFKIKKKYGILQEHVNWDEFGKIIKFYQIEKDVSLPKSFVMKLNSSFR